MEREIKVGKMRLYFGMNFNTNTRFRTNFIMYRKSFKLNKVLQRIFNRRCVAIDYPIGFYEK